ncbi:MAG: hypothetical protein LBE91_04095, partial [Tannerella sp.]|nr:hypothetical protein [Tannerella sp.]
MKEMNQMNIFFPPESVVEDIPAEAYSCEVAAVVSSYAAMVRANFQSFCILDYHKREFLFVAENPLLLSGLQVDKMKETGFPLNLEFMLFPQISRLQQIGVAINDVLLLIPEEDLKAVTVSYDFHIRNRDRLLLINHKITPILLDNRGKV